MMEHRRLTVYVASILSGASISVAWWLPDSLASAVLGWVAACLLVFTARAQRAYLPAYCCGLVCCALGFYWVLPTVAAYGGLGMFLAALLFALFVIGSAVQFLLFAFFHHNLGPRFDALALRAPTALVLSELISVRIFQWHYGHTQLALTPFVQIADIAGAMLVSFLLFWLAEAGVRVVLFRERRWSFLLPLVALGLALGYGIVMMHTYSSPRGDTQQVVLVQGNIPIAEKVDPESVERNAAKLLALSQPAARADSLIVWPENSIPVFLPAATGSVTMEPLLPSLGSGGPAFLVGSFAEETGDKRYVATFAVEPDGRVPLPYYKQVLIPFGEYIPGASLLPWLPALNANAQGFTSGSDATIFEFLMHRPDGSAYTLKASPLICYEDTIPTLSRAATRRGANLLVNLTNDAWFGRSAAPHEHHLIAAFRAIENRRFLVRATNTGLTSVVDPLGRTTARLPTFTDGTVVAQVTLITSMSPYTRFIGHLPWWLLLTVSVAVIAARKWRHPVKSS